MKSNFIFCLLSLLFTLNTFGQPYEPKNYPFDKAQKIELVIFENLETVNENWSKINCVEIPKKEGKIDLSKLVKRKELNIAEINKLYSAVNFKKSDCSENVYIKKKCNEAGYGVIFFDKNDTILEYFEICFNCHQFQVSSNKMSLGLMCYDKYVEFEKLFNKNGLDVIKYREE